VDVSVLSGVAGVAPACALAGAFAKATANASSGPTIQRIGVSFCFDDSKTRGRWTGAMTRDVLPRRTSEH
jgi:hypothetical protein